MKKIIDKIANIKLKQALLLAVVILFTAFTISVDASAANPPINQKHPAGTCTSDPQFDIPYAAITPGNGLISAIVDDVKNVLYTTSQTLYDSILGNSSFRNTVAIAISLYIAIYGIMFTFGMVQSTVYDFFIRMVKIGIISILLGTDATWWQFIYDSLAHFFIDGTDAIIYEVSRITVGGVNSPYDVGKPFAILDGVIATAVSAKMAVTILATFFTGPYGLLFGILMLLSLGSFLRALFTAIWVYLMALVLKMLLIALSPIFISFMLFSRTKPLFDGWINQLVNACLQPIFLFVFFGFFVALIQATMDGILRNPVCWTEWIDSVRGTPFAVHYWRFAVKDTTTGLWEPYGGLWSWTGAAASTKDTRVFPIDIMTILIFLMLAELAGRFNNIVIMIASEIAGASVNLASMEGPLSGWLSGSGGKESNVASGIGSRTGPGGVSASPGYANWQQQYANKGLGAVEDSMSGGANYSAQTGSRSGPGE